MQLQIKPICHPWLIICGEHKSQTIITYCFNKANLTTTTGVKDEVCCQLVPALLPGEHFCHFSHVVSWNRRIPDIFPIFSIQNKKLVKFIEVQL